MKSFRLLNVLLLLCFLGNFTSAQGQITKNTYESLDSLYKINDKVYNGAVKANWIAKTSSFWYLNKSKEGKTFYIVNAQTGEKKEVFDHSDLASKLSGASDNKKIDAKDLPFSSISFSEDLTKVNFNFDGYKWEYNTSSKSLTKGDKEEVARGSGRYWGARPNYKDIVKVPSPDGKWEATNRDNNFYIINKEDNKEYLLSDNGTPGDYYSSYIVWSPDSKKVVVGQIKEAAEKRILTFVESSPKDQLQPKIHTRDYTKPGDVLPIARPRLFDIESKKEIKSNMLPFENQFSLYNIKWSPDSRAFTFEFNQRGHQVFQVVEVNATSGDVKVIIDETSKTFVHYGANIRRDISNGDEIIWRSERDGWSHLYLYDARTGKIKNQITKGAWVVTSLEYVNESERYIIFGASGINQGEDPYSVHYYKINLDGTSMIELTPEKANHSATFSPDYKYFVDVYSRPDMPWVSVVRNAADGKVITELEKADISDLLKTGWEMPEVFVAKGRDGKTDIWGNIYRPSNFNPKKKYPIIENIYAGPHGYEVNKNFSVYSGSFSRLAELGFIVVVIDGMGTAGRSKEFHDVCWRNLKDAGFPDRIAWMKSAAAKYSYMDISRVGIFGGSAGGQNALGALLFHPDFYKAAVSSCGCHDNRMDKIWWNEQWMGYPIGPWYEESSNVTHAGNLQGKLLLIVGEMDDNVDPATTMQVVDALIKKNKDFELLVLPGMGHTLGGNYGLRRLHDFFVKNLLNEKTPDWNKDEKETDKKVRKNK